MGKRYAESDLEDISTASSDEDNGNFKRRGRSYPSGDKDFAQKPLQSFVVPEVSKPLKVVNSRVTQLQIQKQKVVNEMLSKLPKYDDLFDNTAPEVCPQKSSVSKSSDHLTVDTVDSVVDSDVKKKIKVTTDRSDVLAGGDSKDVCKAIDPRLRRLEKFKPPPEPVVEPMPVHALMSRVNELLNARKTTIYSKYFISKLVLVKTHNIYVPKH